METRPPPVLPGTAQLVAPSPNVVWALIDYQALFRSSDQGNTWENRTLPAPFGGRPFISFVDERQGWLLMPGSPATQCEEATADVWHTADGAATWQQLNVSGIAKSQCKDGIWFVDLTHGFISAADPNHRPTIYRTLDGGSTWSATTLPDPPDFQSAAGGFTLYIRWLKPFGRTLYLEAHGSQDGAIHDRNYIFRSTDGGATWQWLTKAPPMGIVMVTEARWLILVGGEAPQETVNGGQQWHPFTTDLNLDSPVLGGTQIVFADALVGYETGRGLLQRTNNGGAHWVRIAIPGMSQASPTPSAAACTPVASGARVSGWLTYTDAQYGFTISYPRNYTFERAGRGNPDIGWLAVYRAVDTCYLGSYPPGQVEINVLVKPDAATLSDFVSKHSRGSCLGSGGLFYGVTNLRAVEAAGRAAVAFDEVGTCAEGPGLVHSTVLILKSGFGFELDWWSGDASLTSSLRDIAQQMLVSIGD